MKDEKYYHTYVMVKPGFANNRKIIKFVTNEILELKNVELPDLFLVDQKYVQYDQFAVNQHYAEHIGKEFSKAYLTTCKATRLMEWCLCPKIQI